MNESFANLDTNTLILLLMVLVAVCLLSILLLIMSNRGLNREVNAMARAYLDMGKTSSSLIDSRLQENGSRVDARLMDMNTRISSMAVENEQKLENIRQSMENRMADLKSENNQQLERMRETVDEKLQKTLEDRISQSFMSVNDRLEQVYKGLGEMQSLAQGVGDLKKVLSNVKTRGILGEVQLGAILEQILTKDQYETDVATVPGSRERVEFAVKLPGEGDQPVYLPIDSKFPGERYAQLRDAYETGSKELIDKTWKTLETTIRQEAKDIHDKYVFPPYTTDFAILFLPFEGLYSEVVNHGMLEALQREYKVNIAGPTTMAALLNSLQMGFRTLAIQKHSSEVWEILGAVKTEFGNFSSVLDQTRLRLRQADDELDKLVGTRTRAIQKKLKSVEALDHGDPEEVLGISEALYFNEED
ncbi:MAG: DNA recombination protein RmuC [Firmicutes bacterium]|nr:DNA recombination protein RmuC [Bacillota bacterium]